MDETMQADQQIEEAVRALAVEIPAGATIAQRLDMILAVAIEVVAPASPAQFHAIFQLMAAR